MAKDTDASKEMVKELHARNTAIFMKLVDSGKVPLRPGVTRLVAEAREADVAMAVFRRSMRRL